MQLPVAKTQSFAVAVSYKGIVPRSDGKDDDLMGGLMSADISGMLGLPGAEKAAPKKEDNTDYGLYTASKNIVSLGSFWYPQLAVRQNGKWADDAPAGLGDVAFSEKSDYRVSLGVPQTMPVAAPGLVSRGPDGRVEIRAGNVRELAVLMSDDYLTKTTNVRCRRQTGARRGLRPQRERGEIRPGHRRGWSFVADLRQTIWAVSF